jgi:RNA 3'-terminal phosphate cyclase (ATP)
LVDLYQGGMPSSLQGFSCDCRSADEGMTGFDAFPGGESRPDAPLLIDGAHGEGGGQILRTAVSLAAITGRAIRMEHIRANRRKPGMAAQHLTAVRAAASLCQAQLSGDTLGSRELKFAPRVPVSAGDYAFDVAQAREGGSAGAVSLVLQTVLVPLSLVPGRSHVTVRGGTHLPRSPPFDYLCHVWLPMLERIGIEAEIALDAWGWFPIGKGQIYATVAGAGEARPSLRTLHLTERGPLRRVTGRAVAANLPSHIPQRMAERARVLLEPLGAALDIRAERVRAACPGAGIFLTANYENVPAGFSALGEVGKPSEAVAEEAVAALLEHHASGAPLDRHLADQLLLPLGFSRQTSTYSVEIVSRHLETNAWVIEQFGLATVAIERTSSGTGRVTITPRTSEERPR